MFWFKKIDKAAWASLVLALPRSHPEQIPTERLSAATDHLLSQLRNIIMESIEIIQRTKNEDTRQGRMDLCRMHLERMEKIKPFANKKQLAIIRECERAFSSVL